MADRFPVSDPPAGATTGDAVTLDAAESHHLAKVMRASAGDTVRVFFDGLEFEAVLERADARGCVARLGAPVTPPAPPRLRAVYALPWLKAGRTEEIARHLTELGAAGFVAYAARRAVAKGDADRMAKLARAAMEACKQCERADTPTVAMAPSLAAALVMAGAGAITGARAGRGLVLAERTDGDETPRLSVALAAIAASGGPPFLVIASGPEGGFHPDELAEAVAGGAMAVSLGPRILRAETAPLAAAAAVLAAGGDL